MLSTCKTLLLIAILLISQASSAFASISMALSMESNSPCAMEMSAHSHFQVDNSPDHKPAEKMTCCDSSDDSSCSHAECQCGAVTGSSAQTHHQFVSELKMTGEPLPSLRTAPIITPFLALLIRPPIYSLT